MNAKIEAALKMVKETQWVGGANIQPTLEHALACLNFGTLNGGNHKLTAKKVAGVNGLFLINKDGSVNFEKRAVKQENGFFVIEYLSNTGFDAFESAYNAA